MSSMSSYAVEERHEYLAPLTAVAGIVALVLAIYSKVISDLFMSWWRAPEQSQGLMITPFAFLMIWIHRHSITAIPRSYELSGLLMVTFGCCMHLFGLLVAGMYISQLSLIFVSAGLIWTLWGFRRLRSLALPLLLLITAIPLPGVLYGTLSRPLQLLTSRVACDIAELAGVTVYREGNIIHLASISLGVWEACNGLTSLSALVVAAILLAFTFSHRLLVRALICMAALPVAIGANVARVSVTAILSDWRPAYALGFYHAFSGWLVFLAGIAMLYLITLLLNWRLER